MNLWRTRMIYWSSLPGTARWSVISCSKFRDTYVLLVEIFSVYLSKLMTDYFKNRYRTAGLSLILLRCDGILWKVLFGLIQSPVKSPEKNSDSSITVPAAAYISYRRRFFWLSAISSDSWNTYRMSSVNFGNSALNIFPTISFWTPQSLGLEYFDFNRAQTFYTYNLFLFVFIFTFSLLFVLMTWGVHFLRG